MLKMSTEWQFHCLNSTSDVAGCCLISTKMCRTLIPFKRLQSSHITYCFFFHWLEPYLLLPRPTGPQLGITTIVHIRTTYHTVLQINYLLIHVINIRRLGTPFVYQADAFVACTFHVPEKKKLMQFDSPIFSSSSLFVCICCQIFG